MILRSGTIVLKPEIQSKESVGDDSVERGKEGR